MAQTLSSIITPRRVPPLATRERMPLRDYGGTAVVCLLVGSLSLLWPHSLTFDPWSWLLWGREIIHGSLNTAGATSWKPLPGILDTLFSLFGGAAPDLWLVLARAGSVMTLILSFRLAAGAAGPLAGALAVAWAVLSIHTGFVFGWLTFFTSGWSEGLLLAAVLVAVEAHSRSRPRIALSGWSAAALIRPEAVLGLVIYAGLTMRRDASLRWLAAGLVLAVALLWLIPDYLGSGRLLLAGQQAMREVPLAERRAAHPGLHDIALLRDLLFAPVLIGAALAVGLARAGVRRLVLVLLVIALGSLLEVSVMAEMGYPGIPRFLVVSVSLLCIVAGIGWGLAASRPPGRARWAAVAAAVALNGVFLVGRLPDLRHQPAPGAYESRLNAQLSAVIGRVGGASAVRRCGLAATNPLEVPALAWDLGYGARVSDRARGDGMIFRTRVYGQHILRPSLPRAGSGYRLIAREGRWSVYARCSPGPSRG